MQYEKKIVLSILLIQIVSFLVLMFLGHYQYITVLNMTIDKKEKDTAQLIDSIILDIKNEQYDHGRIVLSNTAIVKAFANKDKQELSKLTMPIYDDLKLHNKFLTIMQFYTEDNHRFLTLHKPSDNEDNFDDFLHIVAKTNSSKEIQSAIDVSKQGINYIVTFPVFYKNEYLGVFELGVDIKYLISRLTVLNNGEPLFVAFKSAVKSIFEHNNNANGYFDKFTDNYFFVKYKSTPQEEDSILNLVDEKIITKNSYFKIYDSKEYLVFKTPIFKDYKGKQVGYFVFKNEMDYYLNTITIIRVISIITTILIIALIALLINKLIKNYMNKINEQRDVLDYQTHYDELTKLPNRTLFYDRLNQAIQKGERKKSKSAIFFIDLDRFKQINDSLGHTIGDNVLKIIASRLQSIVRKEDSVSRLGGDEFSVLVEGIEKIEDISKLAQNIISVISKTIYTDGHTLYLTNSIGISIFPNDGSDANTLLKNADAAMHRAKEEGRNNFQYYSQEMTEHALDRVLMEANIRNAIKKKEFIVYYQPQVDGKTDKIIGMEALIRWQHPTDGFIFPDKFLPLAQETGLIVAIDKWVMQSAMQQMVKWYNKGLNPGVLALNLSIKQLAQSDFIINLESLIKKTGCKPEWLELEITEGEIMKNPVDAIEKLKKIGDLGIEIAIDDFGTGYSSLSYLKRLPINKLKIDKSFVDGLPDDENDIGIAKTIIALANSLKLNVIAEGVETKEQKDFLVENGCKNIQGYLYSKPVPAIEMEQLLEKNL